MTNYNENMKAEAELFGSLPGTICSGLIERINHECEHPAKLAQEVLSAAAIGMMVGAITRNPALCGEALAPAVTQVAKYGPIVIGAGDLGIRIGVPAVETWRDPTLLHEQQRKLGANLANMIVDVGIAGTAGGAGFKAGESLSMRNCGGMSPAFAAAGEISAPRMFNDRASIVPTKLEASMFRGDIPPAQIEVARVTSGPPIKYLNTDNYNVRDVIVCPKETNAHEEVIAPALSTDFAVMTEAGLRRLNPWSWGQHVKYVNPAQFNKNIATLNDLLPGRTLHWNTDGQYSAYRLDAFDTKALSDVRRQLPMQITGWQISGHRPFWDSHDAIPTDGFVWVRPMPGAMVWRAFMRDEFHPLIYPVNKRLHSWDDIVKYAEDAIEWRQRRGDTIVPDAYQRGMFCFRPRHFH